MTAVTEPAAAAATRSRSPVMALAARACSQYAPARTRSGCGLRSRKYLPPGRPLQLTFSLDGIQPPDALPIRRHDQPMAVQKIPPWVRAVSPAPVKDDPRVCPQQMPGQLALFLTPKRHFTVTDPARIYDREIPDLALVVAELKKIAKERDAKITWFQLTCGMARLALAAREPGERQVRPEVLSWLPKMGPTVGHALDRVGLLAPKRPRLVMAAELVHGSCSQCLAWANDRVTVCASCTQWRYLGHETGECVRCHRVLLLARGLCRFCTIVVAETEIDVDGAALIGGDQLWFGRDLAPHLRTLNARYPGPRRKGRYESKRRLAQAAQRASGSVSAHLTDPDQLELFDAPARDWSRLDEAALPALTLEATAVMEDFTAYIRRRGWTIAQLGASIRTLRILAAYVGVEAPVREMDIKAVASLSPSHQGARVINYLRRRGLLIADEPSNSYLAKARHIADGLPTAFSEPAHAGSAC